MHPSTHAIHTGENFHQETGAVIPPIYMTSTFSHGNSGGFDYTRSGNPSFTNLEKTLAALEKAKYATVFGSGMAAITAVLSTLKSGDLILAEENIYGCTYRIIDQVFEKFGLKVEYYDFTDEKNFSKIIEKKPALVWIESPTNPLLKIIDIEEISKITKKSGSTLVIDNTFASPALQNPLDLGADISLSSSTKYINGHSDALGGVVCTNSKEWNEKMIFAQKAIGLQPSPFDCFLISRGVKTLEVRMKKHCENALKIAEFLEKQSWVKWVKYPFLKSHPQYELAKKQMKGGSGIITAELNIPFDNILRFLKNLKLFTLAESLGGIESLVDHPASMTHASIPKIEREKVGITDGLIRFSIGIEHSEDLMGDIEDAISPLM